MQAQQGRERRPAGPARGADHCGHLSLSCSPKALAGGRGSGRVGSGAPRAFRTPPAPAAAPTGPRAQPADAAQGSPPPRPPGSLPSSGGPVGLSTGTRGNVCPHLASGVPATAPPPCTILTRLRTSRCPMGSDRPSFKPPARCSPEAHAQGPSLFCDTDGTLLSARCPWKSCLLNRPPARWWRGPGPLAEAAQLCRSLAPLRAPREALGTCDHSPRR